MSSSSGAEETLTSPTEANAPVETMDAKLMVATGTGGVQQLKDLIKKEESKMMVVVRAEQAASTEAKKPRQGNMDPHLRALASSGSYEELESLLSREGGQTSGNSTGRSLPVRRASDDTEANESILDGVTAEGDTALHVVAACGQGENFLESARIIYRKAKHLLYLQNKNGDTALHCATRAGKSNMVTCLIEELAGAEGKDRVKELLRKENKDKETALHEAVRTGSNGIVYLLMEEDSELARFPEDGASPLYLAIVLQRDLILDKFFNMSHEKHSFSGQNGQNVLHAAVLRRVALVRTGNERHLCLQNKDLTTQRDENGSTPLHFAVATTKVSRVCQQVLEANADALYQSDHAGLFPIHVAASVGAFWNVNMFLAKYPGSASLRDAKGRTFLHVAVGKKQVGVIRSACRNLSLSWIMNMRDIDGNTALHLAVGRGSFRVFCHLLGNPQVDLNLSNNRGETPLDIAEYKFRRAGLYYAQNSEVQIFHTLRFAGAVNGVTRKDHFKDKAIKAKHDESKDLEALKDSAGTLCFGSVLIATVTFGATFAVPGGYIADDHNNEGTPTLARRYAFDAFIMSNTLAFVFSTMATASLMWSGSPTVNPWSRLTHLNAAVSLLLISITSLTAAFALGAYVVLSPVAHKTAVATCILSSLVPPYKSLIFIWKRLLLLPPLCKRRGIIWASAHSAEIIMRNMLFQYWPLLLIFGWAAYASPAPKTEAPAPLA